MSRHRYPEGQGLLDPGHDLKRFCAPHGFTDNHRSDRWIIPLRDREGDRTTIEDIDDEAIAQHQLVHYMTGLVGHDQGCKRRGNIRYRRHQQSVEIPWHGISVMAYHGTPREKVQIIGS